MLETGRELSPVARPMSQDDDVLTWRTAQELSHSEPGAVSATVDEMARIFFERRQQQRQEEELSSAAILRGTLRAYGSVHVSFLPLSLSLSNPPLLC